MHNHMRFFLHGGLQDPEPTSQNCQGVLNVPSSVTIRVLLTCFFKSMDLREKCFMSQALRGKVSSPMMKYSTRGLRSTSDPARGNQWCYPQSFALAHYTGKSGFQNWIKYQTKKMYIRHPLWLAGQGSGIPCVKVFAPPSSGISDRDVSCLWCQGHGVCSTSP